MLVLYNIKVTVINTITNTLITFNKNFESNIEVEPVNLNNNYHILHHAMYVLDLFKEEVNDYCVVEDITSDLIEIDEYEIVSLTERADVFFENPNNTNVFTLNPQIKCYIYPAENPLSVPELIGTAYDSTTIIWTWPKDMEYAHYLIEEPIDITNEDHVNKIITQLPIGKSSYIETGLTPNTVYSRRLINYTDTQTSLPSPQVSVTTETVTPSLSVENYTVERDYDFTVTDEEKEIIEENLEAFHSGVGDYNDLKVYKQMDSDFYEKFKAYVELTGKRTEREKRYDQVGFNYKICLEATETINEQEGEVTFKVDAYPKQNVSISQYIWMVGTFTVHVKLMASIKLYRGEGGPTNEKTVYIETDNIPFVFGQHNTPVIYKVQEKRVVVVPMDSTMLSSTSTYGLLFSKLQSNEFYTGAYGGEPYNKNEELEIGFVFENAMIKDTYMYSDEDTIHSGNMSYFMETDYSLMGTINVYTDMDSDNNYVISDNSYLWISGYTEAIIYDTTRFANTELNAYNRPQMTLFSVSQTSYDLRNRLNKNVPYEGSIANAHCITYAADIGNLIQIYGDGLSTDMVAKITTHYTSPVLNYRFNLEDPEAYTPFYEILPTSNKLSMDYHIVILTIYYCKNVSVNGLYLNFNPAGVGIETTEKRYIYDNEMIDEYVWFYAQPMTKTQPYYDELPGEGFDSLYGLVNGRYRENNKSGKQDLKVDTPQFNIPTTVTKLHSNSIKIYIKVTEFYPEDALVSYRWDHETAPGSGITQVNGDYITFTCDSLTYKDIDYYDIIGTYEMEEMELFDFKPKTIMHSLKRPEGVKSNPILKASFNSTDSNEENGYTFIEGDETYLANLFNLSSTGPFNVGNYKIKFTGSNFVNCDFWLTEVDSNVSGETIPSDIPISIQAHNENEIIFTFTLNKDYPFLMPIIKVNTGNMYLKTGEIFYSSEIQYKNYYLKVTTSNDDVLASRYPTEVVFNSTDGTEVIPIDFKGVINSTSRWSPRIHNGFYYINQHEHYLYSEFNVKADFDKEAKVVYDSITGYISFEVQMIRPAGPIEEYSISKDTMAELLQDEKSFKWNKPLDKLTEVYGVTLKPVIEGLSYKEYATKTYTSPIILFPNVLTTARILNVDYISTDGTNTGLNLFVRSYDMELGEWTEWVPFTNNTVPEVPLSAGYQIKTDLSATVINTEYTKEDYLACYLDWKEEMHEGVSSNIVTITDHMTTGPDNANGIFISKIIDFSCPSGLQLSMYTSSNKVKGYVAFSNTQDNLVVEKINWVPMNSASLSLKYKYYRYKIEIPSGEKVYWVYKKYKTLSTQETLPFIKEISMTGQYAPEDTVGSFVNIESFNIPRDALLHTVVDRIGDVIGADVIEKGFELNEISKINIRSLIPNIYLVFESNILNPNPDPSLLNGPVDASTDIELIDVTTTFPFIFLDNNLVTIEGTPQQYSPVSVEDEDGNTYTELVSDQFSKDNLKYTEIIDIKEKTKYIELKYNNYDPDSLSIWINDDIINTEDYEITNHLIILKEKELNADDQIIVLYNILRSFYVDVDRKSNITNIYLYSGVNIPMPEKVKIMFETNTKNNKLIAKHLSLNPIYRTDYSGFIYLTNEHNEPYTLNMYCNPKRIKSGGHDRVDVQIEVLDILNNPIIGKKITVDCKHGILFCDSYETDINGIVHLVYESSWLPSSDTITASCMIDDFEKITKSINITNY